MAGRITPPSATRATIMGRCRNVSSSPRCACAGMLASARASLPFLRPRARRHVRPDRLPGRSPAHAVLAEARLATLPTLPPPSGSCRRRGAEAQDQRRALVAGARCRAVRVEGGAPLTSAGIVRLGGAGVNATPVASSPRTAASPKPRVPGMGRQRPPHRTIAPAQTAAPSHWPDGC